MKKLSTALSLSVNRRENDNSSEGTSLGPRPKTNPSTDRFQYRARYTGSDIHDGRDYEGTYPHKVSTKSYSGRRMIQAFVINVC